MESEKQLSPDAEFLKRSCAIFAYMFDSHISPYPYECENCPDPDAQYSQNLPDIDESLTDYMLREVHQADVNSRSAIIEKIVNQENQLSEDLERTKVDSIPFGGRILQRTASGASADEEARKKKIEIDLKRKETIERRRREALAKKQKEKEASVRALKVESAKEIQLKKQLQEKELAQKRIYGKYRAEELMRQKEEREAKREEEMLKEEDAKRLVEKLKAASKRIDEEKDEKQPLDGKTKMERMKAISSNIRKMNDTMSPRKSPRKEKTYLLK